MKERIGVIEGSEDFKYGLLQAKRTMLMAGPVDVQGCASRTWSLPTNAKSLNNVSCAAFMLANS